MDRKEKEKLIDAWRSIYTILKQTGYDILYEKEINIVVKQLRKDMELDK